MQRKCDNARSKDRSCSEGMHGICHMAPVYQMCAQPHPSGVSEIVIPSGLEIPDRWRDDFEMSMGLLRRQVSDPIGLES